jgi:hypothetical protein
LTRTAADARFVAARRVLGGLLCSSLILLICEGLLRLVPVASVRPDLRFVPGGEYRLFVRQGDRYFTNAAQEGVFIKEDFPARKGKRTIRIFMLGGSSIHLCGDFQELKRALQDRFPSRDFEIINCGGNSCGTTRLLLICAEIMDYEPDIVLVYSGHNEFEEAYLTSLPADSSRRRFDGLFSGFRIYQLMAKGIYELRRAAFRLRQASPIQPLFPPRPHVVWGRRFGRQDKAAIYANYRRNLVSMMRMARAKGARFIISTVAYEHLGTPPFGSPRFDDYARFSQDAAAWKKYGTRTSDDPWIEYAWGNRLYQQGDYARAKVRLERAFVLDEEPHRANAITNAIVRDISARQRIELADVELGINQGSQGGLPSSDLFQDHCHLNEKGRRIQLGVFLEALVKAMPGDLKGP